MTIGMRAMFADYASMQTTGHNIANANTPGYSRQTVNVATSGGQFSGAGFFGKGVDVSSVQRASNKFLTMQAQAANSMASMDDARSSQLQQLQNVFPTGATGMGAAMGDFLNSFVDLATDPNDSPIEFDGIYVDLQVRGSSLATGVSDQAGTVPRFGEMVVGVPVTVSAMRMARQAIGMFMASSGERSRVDYVLKGKISGLGFGAVRFESTGQLSLPAVLAGQ